MTELRITPAIARVLCKAKTNGFVMISGGFGDELSRQEQDCFDAIGAKTREESSPIRDPAFDRRSHIEKLIAGGGLVEGKGVNSYLLSDYGEQLYIAIPERMRWPRKVAS